VRKCRRAIPRSQITTADFCMLGYLSQRGRTQFHDASDLGNFVPIVTWTPIGSSRARVNRTLGRGFAIASRRVLGDSPDALPTAICELDSISLIFGNSFRTVRDVWSGKFVRTGTQTVGQKFDLWAEPLWQ
jgi:hypothetical protein